MDKTYSNKNSSEQYRLGFKNGLQKAVLQLKKFKNEPVENIIKGFELIIKILEERK